MRITLDNIKEVRIEPDNIKSIVELLHFDYHAMLNVHESRVAAEFARAYLGEKVDEMKGAKQPVWVGQVVFNTEKVLDIRINEEVQGVAWVGDERKKIARRLVADLNRIDVFEPVEEEKKHFHVFALFKYMSKEVVAVQVFNHNIRLIYDPRAEPDVYLPGQRLGALRMNFYLACYMAYPFQPEKPHRKYCSDRCRDRMNQRRYRKRKNRKK